MKTDYNKLLNFISTLEGLKKIERFKEQVFWREYPFPERFESVADHTWRLAMMLIVIEQHLSEPIDLSKALKMALIHDIPEIITGDKSPLGSDGSGKDSHAYNEVMANQKYEAEKKAAQKIFSKLGDEQGDELYNLWLEYEEQRSFEAKVVKALDKIEAKLQAMEYSKGNVFKKHMEFNVKYGVETYEVDPVIKELGMAVVREFKGKFEEFSIGG